MNRLSSTSTRSKYCVNSHVVCNADMTPADVRVRGVCKLDATGQSLMRAAMQQLQLSARAYLRALKIARGIVTHVRDQCVRRCPESLF